MQPLRPTFRLLAAPLAHSGVHIPPQRMVHPAQVGLTLIGAALEYTNISSDICFGSRSCRLRRDRIKMAPERPLIFLTPPLVQRTSEEPDAGAVAQPAHPSEASPSGSGVKPGTRSLLECQISALIWLNLLLTWKIRGCSRRKIHVAPRLLAQMPPPAVLYLDSGTAVHGGFAALFLGSRGDAG